MYAFKKHLARRMVCSNIWWTCQMKVETAPESAKVFVRAARDARQYHTQTVQSDEHRRGRNDGN
jgi:hypothetical protein